MGGAWVDWPAADDPERFTRFRQMTNIPGCFNVGESDYLYHGANRLGANSLLSCIFGGLVTGLEVQRYVHSVAEKEIGKEVFARQLAQEEQKRAKLFASSGPESVYKLHDELADWLVRYVTVKRNNADLAKTLDKIKEIRERYGRIALDDRTRFANQSYIFASQFEPMLEIANVITKCALLRNESRGSHAKADFEKRNDEEWLKTTIAVYNPHTKEPDVSYVPVQTKYIRPVLRDYIKAEKVLPCFENLPKEMPLPV
jgi:succinate dehydrogenase / fumarate reductase, flavoprotein subunit